MNSTQTLPLVVQKFGGTSVGSLDRILRVAEIIRDTLPDQRNVVVVSAMAGETNRLVEMANSLSSSPNPEALDLLLASGEQVSCSLLSIALSSLGILNKPLLAFQAGIFTTSDSTRATIEKINSESLTRLLSQGIVPIIAGFQGISEKNGTLQVTTLGRGGSDTSAVALAAALKAFRCDIFTDVEGVYTADPRLVSDAQFIEKISYEEMMELASLGAKVLHMRSVELAAKFQVRLRVLSTFNPKGKGTLIMKGDEILESPVVSAVTADQPESLLGLKVAKEIGSKPSLFFTPLANDGINVDVIVKSAPDSSGTTTLSFTVPRGQAKKAQDLLSKYEPWVESESLVKISVVGIGMRTHSGVASKMFETLESAEIPIRLITTSEIKISVMIDEIHRRKALQALHQAFGLDIPQS